MLKTDQLKFVVPIRLRADGAVFYQDPKKGHYATDDWMSRVRVGDIIRTGRVRRTERVIRAATFNRNGSLSSVCCTILHCSWTHSCYTVLTRHNLKYRHARPTGRRLRLRTPLDARIRANIMMRHKRSLDCCDVHGVR